MCEGYVKWEDVVIGVWGVWVWSEEDVCGVRGRCGCGVAGVDRVGACVCLSEVGVGITVITVKQRKTY